MKIGSVGVNQQSGLKEFSAPRPDFGPGVSQALGRAGDRAMELASFLAEKQYKDRRSAADLEWIRWEGETRRRQMDRRVNVEPGADGFTNSTYEDIEKSYEEFQKRVDIPEQDREEYEERFRVFQENSTTDALAFEFEESTRKIGEDISTATDLAAEDVRQDPGLFAAKKEELDIIIEQSSLPPVLKEQLRKQSFNKLAGVVFQQESMEAFNDADPVGPTDGTNAVAPFLTGAQRGFLNGVSRPESGGSYRRRYTPSGGADFDDLSRHPSIFEPTADGRQSSAAGRYQITVTTWNDALRQMRAAGYAIDGSFSEVNQDRVAWFISDQKYRILTGRDLYTDVHSGDPALLRNVFDALGAQGAYADSGDPLFQGFRGEAAYAAFVKDVTGEAALPPSPGTAAPDVWNDPRFAELPYDMKVALAGGAQDMALQAERQRAAGQKAAEKEIEDLAQNLILQNPATASSQIRTMIESNPQASLEHQNKLLELADKAVKVSKAATAATTTSRATASALSLPDRKTMVESYARQFDSAVENDSGRESMLEVFGRLGALPESTTNLLFDKATRGNSPYSLRSIVDLYSARPADFLAGVSEKQGEAALAMTTLREYAPSDEEAARRWSTLNSPEMQQERARLSKQMKEELEEVDSDFILGQVTSAWERNASWLGGVNAVSPKDARARGSLMVEGEELFKKNYLLLGGDADAAWSMTAKELMQVWGPNPVNGELMKYGPSIPEFQLESPVDGFDWLEPEFLRQAELPAGTNYALVGGSFTLEAFMRNGAPAYTLIPFNTEGQMLPPVTVEARKPDALKEREKKQIEDSTKRRDANVLFDALAKENPGSARYKEIEREFNALQADRFATMDKDTANDQQKELLRLSTRIKTLEADKSPRGKILLNEAIEAYNTLKWQIDNGFASPEFSE